MLPQETSVRQLKKLRAETKGTDIGDLTKDDRLNYNVPNLQYIGNPIDTGIESWQEFCQKDNKLQTIAFKSKLVNKPIVKENKTENMNDIKKFEHFSPEGEEEYEIEGQEEGNILNYFKNIWSKSDDIKAAIFKNDLSQYYKYIDPSFDWNSMTDEELEDLWYSWSEDDQNLVESVKTFEHFGEGEEGEHETSDHSFGEGRDEEEAMHNFRGHEYARIKKMEEDEEQEFSERPFEDEEDEDEDNTRPPWRTGFEMNDDDEIDFFSNFEKRPEEIDEIETDDELFNDEDSINDQLESVKTFEAFSIPAAKKEEKQPEYTILGEEKEPKSNPNFGIGAVKAQEIKKISDFNLIDPPTPKERTIGGNAGVFIDNEKVKGYLNRIEGKDAYVESLEDPMVIKKFSLKDVIKTKKEE